MRYLCLAFQAAGFEACGSGKRPWHNVRSRGIRFDALSEAAASSKNTLVSGVR